MHKSWLIGSWIIEVALYVLINLTEHLSHDSSCHSNVSSFINLWGKMAYTIWSKALNMVLSPAGVPPGTGDYEMQSVCACVRACVGACVRPLVCHADFSKTIAVTDFLSKKSPNEFTCPRIF